MERPPESSAQAGREEVPPEDKAQSAWVASRAVEERLGPTLWRHQVVARASQGLRQLEAFAPESVPVESEQIRQAARGLYEDATGIATRRRRWSTEIRFWLTGAQIEAAWRQLHAAEQLATLLEPDEAIRAQVPALSEALRERLPPGDERVTALKSLSDLTEPGAKPSAVDREQIRALKQTLNEITDEAHARIRSFRNLALGVTVALTAVAVVLAFDAPQDEWLPVCAPADASDPTPECATVWQIEIVGALGGLLAVVAALVAFQGFSGPYALPTVMAVLKVPAGALTGLLGAIWMQSEVFGLKAQPGDKILAFVALFGFAQQAITAFADRQAGQLLGQAQGSATGP